MTAGRLHPAAAAEGAERSRRVRDLFAGIAHRYDLVNRIASLGLDESWRRAAVRALEIGPGDWCLDACCGTGDLSRAAAATGADVLGIDFCRPMIEAGRGKGRRGGGDGGEIGFAEGDATALPAATGAFDAACVGFGIRNVVDPLVGLRELRRVLAPGGRLAVLEFSRPRSAFVAAAARLWSDRVVPRLGRLISGTDDYDYLPQTIRAWHRPEELADMILAAGFESVSWRRLSFGIVALHVGRAGASPGAAVPEEHPC